MEPFGRTQEFTITCRYLPYDQWFSTHANSGWKVKRLKECLVAKALSLPFDRRVLERDAPVVRPPSPITFAPEENRRPISPIKFAPRKKKSRAGLSIGSSVDGEIPNPPEAGSSAVTVASSETLAASSTNETDTLLDDDDKKEYDSGGGYEEDDESDDESVHPLSRARTPTGTGGSRIYVGPANSPNQSQRTTALHVKPPHNFTSPGQINSRIREQIFTAPFTFIRYSTGQILEDDFTVGWYHLSPGELIEIHASSPPLSFIVSAYLGDILVKGGSHIIHGVSSMLAGVSGTAGPAAATAISLSKVGFSMAPASNQGSGSFASTVHVPSSSIFSSIMSGDVPGVSLTPSTNAKPGKALTISLSLSPTPFLTSLPRNNPEAYVQPYWEGWVRVLRVVYRPEGDPYGLFGPQGVAAPPINVHGGFDTSGGLALWAKDPGLFIKDGDLARKHQNAPEGSKDATKRRTKMEWRDRWVIIRDGFITLCKDRHDESPAHSLPLNSLTHLRGAEHLVHQARLQTKSSSGKPRDDDLKPGDATTRPNSSQSVAPVSAIAFSSNATLNGTPPRRSTSVSASSTLASRSSTRRGTVSGATFISPALQNQSSMATLASENVSLLTTTPTLSTEAATPRLPQKSLLDSATRPSNSPKPGESKKFTLSPLVVPKGTSNFNRISASAPISPISLVSPLLNTKSSFTSIGASSSKVTSKSSVSSSTSTIHAEPSSSRREDQTRGYSSKDHKFQAGLNKAASPEQHARATEREKERRRMEKDRVLALREAEDLEYLQKWDDFGFGWGKKKSKDSDKSRKGKEKEKDKVGSRPDTDKFRENGKEKERHRPNTRDGGSRKEPPVSSTYDDSTRYQTTDPSVADTTPSSHSRHSTTRQRSSFNSTQRSKTLHLFDKTYIPSSKEEADSAGMRIVCAKFRVERSQKPSETGQGDDRTGRGKDADVEVAKRKEKEKEKKEKDRKKKLEKEKKNKDKRHEDLTSLTLGQPPRKTSLPGLGLGFGSNRDKEKRKERSFESKKKEKEHRKSKNSDDSVDDMAGATGSALSWKLGKRRKQHVESDADPKSAAATDDERSHENVAKELDSALVHVQVDFDSAVAGGSQRPKLAVATNESFDEDSDDDVNLSSPVFAHSTDSDRENDGDLVQERRRGYRYGGYHDDKLKKQQQQQKGESEKPQESKIEHVSAKPPPKKRDNDKYEWIVLDMGSQTAYQSLLRILHRHLDDTTGSSFLNGSSNQLRNPANRDNHSHYMSQDEASSDEDNLFLGKSRHPTALKSSSRSMSSPKPFALPYPEWRNEATDRARTEPMLDSTRVAELARNVEVEMTPVEIAKKVDSRMASRSDFWTTKMADWQSRAPKQGVEDRKFSEVTIRPNKGKERLVDHTEYAISAPYEEDIWFSTEQKENSLANDPYLLDSEEESEEEFARWWRDIPRQDFERKRQKDELEKEALYKINAKFQDRFTFSSPFNSATSSPPNALSAYPPVDMDRRPPISMNTASMTLSHVQYIDTDAVSPTTLTSTPSTLRTSKTPDPLLSHETKFYTQGPFGVSENQEFDSPVAESKEISVTSFPDSTRQDPRFLRQSSVSPRARGVENRFPRLTPHASTSSIVGDLDDLKISPEYSYASSEPLRHSTSLPNHPSPSQPLGLPGTPPDSHLSSTSISGLSPQRESTITLPVFSPTRRPVSHHGHNTGWNGDYQKPILSLEEIRRIEMETRDTPQRHEPVETMTSLTITPTRQISPTPFGSSPPSIGRALGKKYTRGAIGSRGAGRIGHTSGSERESEDERPVDHASSYVKRRNPELSKSTPTSPSLTAPPSDLPWNSSNYSSSMTSSPVLSARHPSAFHYHQGSPPHVEKQTAHAKNILQRVRSGSSLHLMPMGVHFEHEESDGSSLKGK